MGGGECADAWHAMAERVETLDGGGGLLLALPLAGALAALLWRGRGKLLALAALSTRLRRDDVLAHPLRARALDAVKAAPGASTPDLARATGANEGTLLYHLRVLERAGFVKSLAVGRRRAWFEASARAQPPLPPERARVLDAVRERPGGTLTELARRLGLAKSTAHHHVDALAQEGRVQATRSGRTMRLDPK